MEEEGGVGWERLAVSFSRVPAIFYGEMLGIFVVIPLENYVIADVCVYIYLEIINSFLYGVLKNIILFFNFMEKNNK